MSAVRRGDLYRTEPSGRQFLVVSIDMLNDTGTTIVVEVVDEPVSGIRGMLMVPLAADDPAIGLWVLSWRVNYMNAARLGQHVGAVSAETLNRVISAITAAIEP